MKSTIHFVDYHEIEDKLLKEKTELFKPNTDDLLIQQLCPQDPQQNQLDSYNISLKCLQKFIREFTSKLRFNSYNLNFDDCRIQSNKNNFIMWQQNKFNVLIPIKKPMNIKFIELPSGFISCPITNIINSDPMKILINQIDDLSILSSHNTSQIISMFLKETLPIHCQIMKDFVKLLEVNYNEDTRLIETKFGFSSNYLTIGLMNSDKENLKADDSDNEKSMKIDSDNDTAIIVSVVFVPALTINSKNNKFAIPLNSSHRIHNGKHSEMINHLWREENWWDEQKIMNKINSADQKLRTKAAIGLYKLLQNDSDFNFLTEIHFRHNLLTLFDSDSDNTMVSWQRKTLFSCFMDQLQHLKFQIQQKYVVNYFTENYNLLNLANIDQESLRKANEKLSLLVNSKTLLIKAITKFVEN